MEIGIPSWHSTTKQLNTIMESGMSSWNSNTEKLSMARHHLSIEEQHCRTAHLHICSPLFYHSTQPALGQGHALPRFQNPHGIMASPHAMPHHSAHPSFRPDCDNMPNRTETRSDRQTHWGDITQAIINMANVQRQSISDTGIDCDISSPQQRTTQAVPWSLVTSQHRGCYYQSPAAAEQ
jgi:hypothetical protein